MWQRHSVKISEGFSAHFLAKSDCVLSKIGHLSRTQFPEAESKVDGGGGGGGLEQKMRKKDMHSKPWLLSHY